MKKTLYMVILALAFVACTKHPKIPANYETVGSQPDIYPDYKEVVVPPNIAPLNFGIRGNVTDCVAQFTLPNNQTITFGSGNKVLIDEGDWHDMLAAARGGDIKVEVFALENNRWRAYMPFNIRVAKEEIDPYISYRLIFPSYVAYEMLSICQRNLSNFDEKDIYNNMIISGEKDGQCINCHSYQNYGTANMQFHMRQGHGGTMLVVNNVPQKIDLKTDSTISAGVYPAWHPTLPLIAYSTNHTGQSFHTRSKAKIEVQDSESDVILYDIEKNEVRLVSAEPNELECFPTWSPDGKYLYFCSAHFERQMPDSIPITGEMIERYQDLHYDIYRKSFDAKKLSFGPTEVVYKASEDSLSATFPRISPDGRYLLTGIGAFGCFHVWHPDADLYLMDLQSKQIRKLENVNSDYAESYHNWSSNGRWMIFISRRNDSNFSRLYIAYFDQRGMAHKAFALPQRDPDFYTYFMRSYNVPEFMKEPVQVTPQEFASEARKPAKKATYVSTDAHSGASIQNQEAKHTVN
ncbi:MAG: PD40 domain-containing protein [Bacteroidaceae bacterium]|nr:PD40 domain-containing protein [Bacteroidaceae bacterium]